MIYFIDYSSDNQSKLYFFQVHKYSVIQPIWCSRFSSWLREGGKKMATKNLNFYKTIDADSRGQINLPRTDVKVVSLFSSFKIYVVNDHGSTDVLAIVWERRLENLDVYIIERRKFLRSYPFRFLSASIYLDTMSKASWKKF